LDILNFDIEGNTFSTNSATNEIILSDDVKDSLFKVQNPIGKTVYINQKPFTIIGLVDMGDGIMGQTQTGYVTVATYSQKIEPVNTFTTISVQFKDTTERDQYIPIVEKVLRKSHNLQFDEENDFYIQTQEDTIESASAILGAVTAFISLVSGISLLVGGVGIMNIMLVSVKERVKEFGLRKAIGATNANIRNQILIESIIFSLLGGIIGVILGNIGAITMEHFSNLPTVISINAIVTSLLITTLTGLIFGLYPAITASKLSPIEALRSE
jgi:putative ABC transport system permease protein